MEESEIIRRREIMSMLIDRLPAPMRRDRKGYAYDRKAVMDFLLNDVKAKKIDETRVNQSNLFVSFMSGKLDPPIKQSKQMLKIIKAKARNPVTQKVSLRVEVW